MKKFLSVFPVLLIICAGIVMMVCTSDPDPKTQDPPIDSDYTLVDGKVVIPLTTTSIAVTNDGEYDVILDVEEVDDALLGCHFKGSLFYKSGETLYLLSGLSDAFPNVVAFFPRKYRWTFKAGAFGDDSSSEAATSGGYTVPSNGTVPSGASLEFHLTAMTPKWHYFGASDAEKFSYIAATTGSNATTKTEAIDYKTTGIKCGIKEASSLVFRQKPTITWVEGEAVASNGGSAANANTGKGNIQDNEWQKVKNAPAGSILRFNCTVNVGTVGSNSREPGWGFGGVGGNVDGDLPKARNQDQNISLLIPKGTEAGTQTFDIDIFVEDVIASSNANWSFVNTNDTTAANQKINSIKIYSPQQ